MACLLVVVESSLRLSACNFTEINEYDAYLSGMFLCAYCFCVCTILLNLKDVPFFQSITMRNIIKFLHAMDGINALLIGIGMYYRNLLVVALGLLCMTKLFLLCLLSRMVTGIKTHSTSAVVLQTTKTFLHHIGSFMFIATADRNVALITALWRFVSMNGHAAMTLRTHVTPHSYDKIMWIICHMRNAAVVVLMLLCVYSPYIRRGFGE